MTKLTLTDVGNFQNETTAATAINANNTAIENAVENTISRDGSSPNMMNSNLDMNSNQIINLPLPATSTSPLRLQDLSDFIGTGVIASIPVGGTTGQVLAKTSNTDFATDWENSVTSVGLALPADFTVTNSPVTTTGTLTGAWATPPTGTGAVVRATSPTLVTPALGTPSSGVATNLTGTAAGLTAGNVTTNANLTGDVTSVGNATTLTNAPVIAKVLTGYTSGAGAITSSDSILSAIQKLNGNDATNANLTGPITSVGNATSIASQTGTGTKFVVDTSPTLVTPVLGVATATSVNKVALTAPATSATLTIANGKTLTANNSLTLNGTDSTVLTFPSTSDTIMALGAGGTITGGKSWASGTLNLLGSVSGTSQLNAASAAGTTTLTLPAATDTLIGKATTDTLTNKTYDTAGTGNSLLINGLAATANTGTGAVVRATSPTLVTPALGTPTALVLTSATGLPISTGVSGLGTGNATALAVNVGSTGAFVTDTSTNTLTNKTINAVSNTFGLPYFAAHSTAASQAATTAVDTKIVLATEVADSNNWFDNATNYRFTPQLAGKYRVTGHASGVSSGGTLTEIDVHIYKNGTVHATSFNVSAAVAALSLAISKIVSFNGTTDYVELFATLYGTGTLSFISSAAPVRIWFEAQYVGA